MGDYVSTDYINSPTFNYVDLSTNKVFRGAAIFSGNADRLDDMQVCADYMYYIATPAGQLRKDAVLWVTPMADLTKRNLLELPDASLYYYLGSCTAVSK